MISSKLAMDFIVREANDFIKKSHEMSPLKLDENNKKGEAFISNVKSNIVLIS